MHRSGMHAELYAAILFKEIEHRDRNRRISLWLIAPTSVAGGGPMLRGNP